VEREDGAVALRDEGSDADAAEADGAQDEAPAAGLGSWQEAVTEAPPIAGPVAAPELSTSAEDPAATVVDILPHALADAVTADAGAADAGIVAVRGGAGGGNWISNIASSRPRPSWKIATAAACAAAVIAAGLVIVAVSGSSHGRTTASAAKSGTEASHKKKAETVSVVSVSPGNGSTGVNGAAPIAVTYSGRITNTTPLPTMSPSIAGSWQVSGDKATFVPQVGFTEDTHVRVHIPASAGTTTTAATTFSFTTGHYSVLRLDQLLSQLGYIPVSWAPTDSSGDIPATDASAQLAAAYDPPSGTFSFESGYPTALTSMWSVGTDNEIIDGAVRTFEFDQGLTLDGDAGRHVWSDLFTAIARDERNQHGYTYVWVTQAGTEHLDLYHNGQLAITSAVNTGIAQSPTVDGTFPVYLRYQVTQMKGKNPDGSLYDDTVYWVSYFNGGDAVHAFPRGSYGWYQSLGCVELPSYGSTAEDVWNLITYGTLVTVTGPVA
jgi:L,D-transpeptidase catalytic domain